MPYIDVIDLRSSTPSQTGRRPVPDRSYLELGPPRSTRRVGPFDPIPVLLAGRRCGSGGRLGGVFKYVFWFNVMFKIYFSMIHTTD